MSTFIITIDGPAGAGKSTIAKELARKLGIVYLDTGAMYRAFTWKALNEKVNLDDKKGILRLIKSSRFEFKKGRVYLDSCDITGRIRGEKITGLVHELADSPVIRRELVRLQRSLARNKDIVTEGRDQGSVAFPNAKLKIYLDASLSERVRRRSRDLQRQGIKPDTKKLKAQILTRDKKDTQRKWGGLKKVSGSYYLDSTNLSVREVVSKIVSLLAADRQVSNELQDT